MESKINNYELPLDKAIDADALFMEMTQSPRHESDTTPIPHPSSKNNGAPQASDTSATVASLKEPSPPYEKTSTSEALAIKINERRGTNLGRRASDYSTVRSGRRASDRTEEQRFRDVWTTLRSIDCNALSKRSQGGIHWYEVLDLLMSHFPLTSWDSLPDTHHADGSVEVGCRITINGVSRTSTLPVETTSGGLLSRPNAKQVSQARMDCWVNCVALFGLGLDMLKQTNQ